jgi:MoaA/NifB/PqqE/SkfB family radical SAM enzyme
MDQNSHSDTSRNFEQKLSHILKLSSADYEAKLREILSSRLPILELEAYRQRYLNSYRSQDAYVPSVSTITINISDSCNFKCTMCDVPGNNRLNSHISLNDIKNFLCSSASLGVQCCMLGSGSEITLHPNWREILDECIKLFPDTILFTNGSLLNKSDLAYFVKSGLTRLFVSLDSSSSQTFKKIRGYDLLHKIESNILDLVALKRQLSSLTPLVRVSFVLQNDNCIELDSFIEKWINIVDSVEIQDYMDIAKFRKRDYADTLSELVFDDTRPAPSCHYPFTYLSLWSSGNISPCCTSYGRDSKELIMANIYDDDWENTLSLKRQAIQHAFISQDWSQIPNTCRHCLMAQNKDPACAGS